MYYNLIIKSKSSFLDRIFTYSYEGHIEIGSRVVVPFGRSNRLTLALIVKKLDIDKPDFETKEIIEVIDYKPILNEELMNLVRYMSENNISDYSKAIGAVLPPGDINHIEEYYMALEDDGNSELLSFLNKARSFSEIKNKYSTITRTDLNELIKDGRVLHFYDKVSESAIKYKTIVKLIDNRIELLHANARKQRDIINYLEFNGDTERKKLLRETNSSTSSLKSLENRGFIYEEKIRIYRNVITNAEKYEKHILNKEQYKVYKSIRDSKNEKFLIHGVTGSGKTEIYLHLVEDMIKQGKSSIILVPEISLTPQTIKRFRGRFGDKIAVLHSKLSISQRADQWSLIKNGKVEIVVGARSAIFAPLDNLGLIIIDEEHDSSYKSVTDPKYSAIEIAELRASYNKGKLILGSATPSIDTMYKVAQREYEIFLIEKRANLASLPIIELVDMRDELKHGNLSMFSEKLQNAIVRALEKKEQVMLYLNKRGHTSYVFCRKCGYIHRCEACDVSMTYHKHNNRLVCHYCGRTGVKSRTCVNCGSNYIKEFGAGTQMLEEETRKMFPQANIYRMDADTTKTKADYEDVYDKMINGKIDILIGTQMITKGFDFPNVTVVSAIAADLSLNLPDHKAGERTFQLLSQLAGRAGRAKKQGYVVIQSYKPDNYAIQAASKNDYYSFFREEIKKRKKFDYPPFTNILLINTSHKNRNIALQESRKLMIFINQVLKKQDLEIEELTGPTASVIERINNYYRFNIILKSIDKRNLIFISNIVRNKFKQKNGFYINYFINPENID